MQNAGDATGQANNWPPPGNVGSGSQPEGGENHSGCMNQ